jgi:hypothetical protein
LTPRADCERDAPKNSIDSYVQRLRHVYRERLHTKRLRASSDATHLGCGDEPGIEKVAADHCPRSPQASFAVNGRYVESVLFEPLVYGLDDVVEQAHRWGMVVGPPVEPHLCVRNVVTQGQLQKLCVLRVARVRVRVAQYPVAELAGVVVLLGEVEDHVMIAVMALEEFGDLRYSGHGENTLSGDKQAEEGLFVMTNSSPHRCGCDRPAPPACPRGSPSLSPDA